MTDKMKPFHMGYLDEWDQQYESVRTEKAYAMSDREVDHTLDVGLEMVKRYGVMLILSETGIKTIF